MMHMKNFAVTLIYLCFLQMCNSIDSNNDELEHFLRNRQDYAYNHLTALLQETAFDEDVEIQFQFYVATSKVSPHALKPLEPFSLFNDTFTFLGPNLFRIVFNEEEIEFVQQEIRVDDKILFVKTVAYKNAAILLIALQSHSLVYYVSEEKISFIQSIHNVKEPSSAKFFENCNNLYLIIVYSAADASASTIVYKWTTTHFDEVVDVLLKDAVSVLSFSFLDSELILISQNNTARQVLYEFHNDDLRKKQLLTTVPSSHAVSYTFKQDNFIVFFGDHHHSLLYWWDGFELLKWTQFQNYSKINRILRAEIEDVPVIFLSQEDHVLAFAHTARNFHLAASLKIRETFSEILHMQILNRNGTNYLLIFFTNEDVLKYMLVQFDMQKQHIGLKNENLLLQCTKNLEKQLEMVDEELNRIEQPSKKILQKDEFVEYPGQIIAPAVQAESSVVNVHLPSRQLYQKGFTIKNKLITMSNTLEELNANILPNVAEGNTINANIIFENNLQADELTTRNMSLGVIDGVRWDPSLWLSYTKSQIFNNEVTVNTLKAVHLQVASVENLKLPDLFPKTFDTRNLLQFNSAVFNNVHVNVINDVPIQNVYLKSRPIGFTNGVIRRLFVGDLNANYINNVPMTQFMKEDIKTTEPSSSSILKIHNLNVETINGVNWTEFANSVFRFGSSQRIAGNVTVASIDVDHLYTPIIDKIHTDTMMTATTDQIITTTLQVDGIYVDNIQAESINGIRFEDVTLINKDVLVKGPVSITNFNVKGDVQLVGEGLSKNDDHIIGTKTSDLLQIYNKKVKILGNLLLTSLKLNENTSLDLNGENIQNVLNLTSIFWSKSKNQEIPTFFHAHNGFTVPHIITEVVNDISINDFLKNNLEDYSPTNFVFQHVTVPGNIEIDHSYSHIPNLVQLDAEVVRITGSFTILNQKSIHGRLIIGNLETAYLNDVPLERVLTLHYDGTLTGNNTFENVIIARDIRADKVSTSTLNNILLDNLQKTALYIDTPTEVDAAKFEHLHAENILTGTVNNKNFDSHVVQVDFLYDSPILNDVYVKGDVVINQATGILQINNITFDHFITSTNTRRQKDLVFDRDVRFTGNVFVENLEVRYVNNVDFANLIPRILYNDWDQNITAVWDFHQINTRNVYVPQINDVVMNNLIDIKNTNLQTLFVREGLVLSVPTFGKSLHAEVLPCNLFDAMFYLNDLPTAYWDIVHVAKNASFSDVNSDMYRILNDAVVSDEMVNIDAEVIFNHHVSATFITADNLINGIKINDLLNDAVLKSSYAEQIITGYKSFRKLSISEGFIQGNGDIALINDVYDIVDLDSNIVSKDQINNLTVTGEKVFFGGLQANRLRTETIFNLNPTDLVNLNNMHVIRQAFFDNLKIANNLNIEYANGIQVKNCIENRIKRFSNDLQDIYGNYHITENVYIIGNSSMNSINNISVDDVVVDASEQIVTGNKIFVNDVSASGDVGVNFLNGYNFSDRHDNSVLKNEKATIKGNLEFRNETFVTGNMSMDFVNGVAVDRIKGIMNMTTPAINTEIINKLTDEISLNIKRSANLIKDMSETFLYLQKATALQIPIPNLIKAYMYTHNDNVIFHLIQQEDGLRCGLNRSCVCPIQNVIEITPHLSVAPISISYYQRLFTYNDEDVVIHIFTNTISTDRLCRSNASVLQNEFTSVSFTTKLANGSRPIVLSDDKITGYVSEAQFFKFDGNIYMVLSRYYEPNHNTHKVSCLVYKFIKQTGEIFLIQRIPCEAAWTLRIVSTIQGTVLVIGSVFKDEVYINATSASIYRFNEVSEKFLLLRRVLGSSCNTAAGVVLGPDSLIVMGHKTTLQILKYHPKYDNYYFYQNIYLTSPVHNVNVFYIGDFGKSDCYLTVATENGKYSLYVFQYSSGWRVAASGELQDCLDFIPFKLNGKQYLFAVSTNVSSILTVVKQGPN